MLIGKIDVSLHDLRLIYEGGRCGLDPAARHAVERARSVVAKAAGSDAPVYGVNTGFGQLATVRIGKAETAQLQRNLVLSHCGGVGEQLSDPVVRLVLALKMISLARGASGVRWALISLIAEMLAHNVVPVVPAKGSVGASGDLAPLAHVAAVMMGEGQAKVGGQVMNGRKALLLAGLKPLEFQAKEGLALLNGTQVSTALALAGLFEAWIGLATSLTTGALSTDAAMGSTAPFRSEIHELRRP